VWWLVVASAQVPLELARDRLAGGLRQRRRVLGLLEGADVLAHLAVALGQLVDAALPRLRLLHEVVQRDRHVEQLLDPAHECERGLGRRSSTRIVRLGGPE
jgi:hypothetical protein